MAGIFQRLFKTGQAEAHAIIDKFEDPIKMSEQAIRDLKKDLQESLRALAEVKSIAIRLNKEAEDSKRLAEDYERRGHADVEVRVRAYVSLNGRKLQLFVDPALDLAAETRGGPYGWIKALSP